MEDGDGRTGRVGRAVDRLVGGLPLPPKSMQVLRGEELRKLGDGPGADASPTSGEAADGAACPASHDEGPYARRLRGLLRDLRIFALCNLGLFALTAFLIARRQSRAIDYLVPAGVLAATTLSSSIIYFMGRDWFWSFLDGSFAGIAYLMLVTLVAALLADVAWNRARVARLLLRLLWWVPV